MDLAKENLPFLSPLSYKTPNRLLVNFFNPAETELEFGPLNGQESGLDKKPKNARHITNLMHYKAFKESYCGIL